MLLFYFIKPLELCGTGSDGSGSRGCDPLRFFVCANGFQCVPNFFVCDRLPDCLDGSDENFGSNWPLVTSPL